MVQLQEISAEMADRLTAIEKEHEKENNSTTTSSPSTSSKTAAGPTVATAATAATAAPIPPPDIAGALMGQFPTLSETRAAFAEKKTVDEVAAELKRSPFFMTELEENDETEAFKALAYEGTPLENAAEFKQQGNGCFKIKRWADAKEFYAKGILILAAEEWKRRPVVAASTAPGGFAAAAATVRGEKWQLSADERQQAADENWAVDMTSDEDIAAVTIARQKELLEALYGNRAACHLELRNYRSCWLDGASALRLNDKNVKAYYRSARALLAVDRVEQADDACSRGLEVDPDNVSLRAVARDIIKRSEEISARQRQEAEREAREKRRAMLLRAAIKARGIPMRETAQPPEMEDAKVELVPDPDDPRSTLSFPTVLLYPTDLQSDFVKAFNETQSVGEHLEYILPLPWDKEGKYVAAKVECYMETMTGGLIKVGKKLPLLKILSSGKIEVVDEVVRIFVVPKTEADAWVAEFKRKKAAERGES
ncbi:tetratricopeptide repeat protein 4 [Microdochium nivale]|nr:tetratricopeptide repeat protein 4 [Microdochium nivale]